MAVCGVPGVQLHSSPQLPDRRYGPKRIRRGGMPGDALPALFCLLCALSCHILQTYPRGYRPAFGIMSNGMFPSFGPLLGTLPASPRRNLRSQNPPARVRISCVHFVSFSTQSSGGVLCTILPAFPVLPRHLLHASVDESFSRGNALSGAGGSAVLFCPSTIGPAHSFWIQRGPGRADTNLGVRSRASKMPALGASRKVLSGARREGRRMDFSMHG